MPVDNTPLSIRSCEEYSNFNSDYGAGSNSLVLSVRRYATRLIHSFITVSSRDNARELKPNTVCTYDIFLAMYSVGKASTLNPTRRKQPMARGAARPGP
jgi:hypothetical protein